MTKDEALKRAFDWYGTGNQDPDEFEKLILSIVEQLEQPEPPEQRQERDWGAAAEKQLAALKRDSKAFVEDAAVRAVYKVMSDHKLMQPPPDFIDALKYDVAKRDSEAVVKQCLSTGREWVRLTEEEIDRLRHLIDWTAGWSYAKFARAIEALCKEKNHG